RSYVTTIHKSGFSLALFPLPCVMQDPAKPFSMLLSAKIMGVHILSLVETMRVLETITEHMMLNIPSNNFLPLTWVLLLYFLNIVSIANDVMEWPQSKHVHTQRKTMSSFQEHVYVPCYRKANYHPQNFPVLK